MKFLLQIFPAFFVIFLVQGCACNCGCDDASPGTNRGDFTAVREREQMKIPDSDLRNKFYKLLMTMDSRYHPPLWIPKHNLGRYMGSTIVYYSSTLIAAKDLVYKREPCRLDGVRKYDLKKMELNFKYDKSPISYKTTELIATYTLTPFKFPSTGEFVDVQIFSVPWPNFGDPSSPELEIMKITNSMKDREIFLGDFFHLIFSKLLRCAIQNKIQKFVVGDLGIAKSIQIAHDKFGIDYVAIMNQVFSHYFKSPFVDRSISVGTSYLSVQNKFEGNLVEAVSQVSKDEELGITLFVNSANAFALLGNGNEMENTSNGIFGRYSAISMLGWGVTNSKIRYVFVVPDTRGYQLLNEVD